jgi:1,2-diacylglycerol 3-alpha-glucosyltransferase/glucuronosyltransferase
MASLRLRAKRVLSRIDRPLSSQRRSKSLPLRLRRRIAASSPSENAPEEVNLSPWFTRARNQLRQRRGKKKFAPTSVEGLKVLIVSDAWKPQVNGVVRTMSTLGDELEALGNEVRYVTPDLFRTLPMPTYPEIQLAALPGRRVRRLINEFKPDAIHIATEGPLGIAARQFCIHRDHPFSTSFHTKFPEYLNARTKFPVRWGYEYQRRFHKPASATMVTTPSMKIELEKRGFRNLRVWSRGVDLSQFEICSPTFLDHLPRPIWLYVGRVAVEKNIEAFLDLDLEGTKLVVGDGPLLEGLRVKHPGVEFVGPQYGDNLVKYYSASDVFVFPSLTDTFGLVNVEALASGTPVAAYPVTGPIDIVEEGITGCLNQDLKRACLGAWSLVQDQTASPEVCREHAMQFSWTRCTKQFLENLAIPGYDETYWLESANFPD